MITILILVIISSSKVALPVEGLLVSGGILDITLSVLVFIVARDIIKKWRGY